MAGMRDKIKSLLIAYEGYGFSATANAILLEFKSQQTRIEELEAQQTLDHENINLKADFIDAAMNDSAADAERIDKLTEALTLCQEEIDQYIVQEYPTDHPVHERYRQRDFSANPARIAIAALKEDE